MTPLKEYLQDGANYQARAVMCALQNFRIEDSWNPATSEYEAEPKIARWENCREQGYVLTLWNRSSHKRLCVAFFEHRNSDSICALKWEQNGINSPTIDTADYGGACYKDKWDVSFQVGVGQFEKMADWISSEMESWWIAAQTKSQKTSAGK